MIVEKTPNHNVYYPEYTKIDLVCGQMPKTTQKDVEFCCEAALFQNILPSLPWPDKLSRNISFSSSAFGSPS